MRISIISDTHCQLSAVRGDPADILIHCGDFTFRGNDAEIAEFVSDLTDISDSYGQILLVAGNHDWMCQVQRGKFERYLEQVPNAIWLQDKSVELHGLKFFGTAWQPYFMDWAFNVYRGDLLREKFSIIPDDTDVLITHCPPFGILDETPGGELVGSAELREKIEQIRPVVNCFGHIHHSRGWMEKFGTTFINASICTERYKPTNKPVLIEIEEGKLIKIYETE